MHINRPIATVILTPAPTIRELFRTSGDTRSKYHIQYITPTRSTQHSSCVKMDSNDRNDAFSLKFYNQGLSCPATNVIRRLPSDAPCTYHAAVLGPRPQQPGSHSATFSRQMLQYVPPSCLTQDWSTGTSASCGCTCASARGIRGDNMAREIDTIVRASKIAATTNTSGER